MKSIIVALTVLAISMAANAQSGKIVIDAEGTPVGRYIAETDSTFHIDVQDECDIPKAGHTIKDLSAENGEGILYINQDIMGFSEVNIFAKPDATSRVISKIFIEEGCVPDTYNCLGVSNGWYKIDLGKKKGYVRKETMKWDSISSF